MMNPRGPNKWVQPRRGPIDVTYWVGLPLGAGLGWFVASMILPVWRSCDAISGFNFGWLYIDLIPLITVAVGIEVCVVAVLLGRRHRRLALVIGVVGAFAIAIAAVCWFAVPDRTCSATELPFWWPNWLPLRIGAE